MNKNTKEDITHENCMRTLECAKELKENIKAVNCHWYLPTPANYQKIFIDDLNNTHLIEKLVLKIYGFHRFNDYEFVGATAKILKTVYREVTISCKETMIIITGIKKKTTSEINSERVDYNLSELDINRNLIREIRAKEKHTSQYSDLSIFVRVMKQPNSLKTFLESN